MGKTAFALNIARNAAVDSNIPVAFFSLEMAKEQLVMRLLFAEARLNATRLRDGFTTKQDWEILNQAGCTLLLNGGLNIVGPALGALLLARAGFARDLLLDLLVLLLPGALLFQLLGFRFREHRAGQPEVVPRIRIVGVAQ